MMKSLLLTLCSLPVLFSCQESAPPPAPDLELDEVRYSIQSAGIGYDVKGTTIDSSSGLNYIVALNLSNEGTETVRFSEASFRLFDEQGREQMPSGKGDVAKAVHEAAFRLELPPNETVTTMLFFSASGRGSYRFRITSPRTKTQKEIALPRS